MSEIVIVINWGQYTFLGFCFQNNFSVRIEDDNVSPSDVRGEIKGPDSSPTVRFNWTGSIGDGLFTPEETGIHRVIDKYKTNYNKSDNCV